MTDLAKRSIAIVPTYNERANLASLVQGTRRHAPGMHILFVDDNSPDGTGACADDLARTYPDEVFVLHRQRKEGLGKAYIAGFTYAMRHDYEFIIQMDGDSSHDPVYLPDLLAAAQECDLVVGSRYIRGVSVVNWDLKRIILSKLATRYVQLVTGLPFTDATSGYNCWRRRALEQIGFASTFASGYMFLIEMKFKAFRAGLSTTEVPIIFVERASGDSKLSKRILWEAIYGVLRLRLRY